MTDETLITNTEPTPETPEPHPAEPITNTTPIYPIKSGLAEAHPDMLRKSKEKWPWRTMNEGEYVTVPAHMAKKAQKAAHAYGSLNGIKFSTKMDNLTGKMIIGRIPKKERYWEIDPYEPTPPTPVRSEPRYKLIPVKPKPTNPLPPVASTSSTDDPSRNLAPGELDTDGFPW